MDSEAIGVVSTLVVDETRCGLEIMDVLIFFVDLCLGSSSDTVTLQLLLLLDAVHPCVVSQLWHMRAGMWMVHDWSMGEMARGIAKVMSESGSGEVVWP